MNALKLKINYVTKTNNKIETPFLINPLLPNPPNGATTASTTSNKHQKPTQKFKKNTATISETNSTNLTKTSKIPSEKQANLELSANEFAERKRE